MDPDRLEHARTCVRYQRPVHWLLVGELLEVLDELEDDNEQLAGRIAEQGPVRYVEIEEPRPRTAGKP